MHYPDGIDGSTHATISWVMGVSSLCPTNLLVFLHLQDGHEKAPCPILKLTIELMVNLMFGLGRGGDPQCFPRPQPWSGAHRPAETPSPKPVKHKCCGCCFPKPFSPQLHLLRGLLVPPSPPPPCPMHALSNVHTRCTHHNNCEGKHCVPCAHRINCKESTVYPVHTVTQVDH